ncbi:MAG: AAA family ATPase [Fimbriimonadaceae bacterium]|nr:AAA family ATPase [Fimbriimonadaceae bacterium]
MVGLPGAGKTTAAAALTRLAGHQGFSADDAITAAGITTRAAADAIRAGIEQEQVRRARELARAGAHVWLDHGFWSAAERAEWREWGRRHRVRIVLIWCEAPAEVRWARLAARVGPFRPLDRAEFDGWTASFEVPNNEELAEYDAFERLLADET